MRTPTFALLVGVVTVAACDSSPEIAGPSPQSAEPQFHEVTPGTPDGDYSLYFFGVTSVGDLALSTKQSWSVTPDPWATECPNNAGSHADGDPDYPGDGQVSPAVGKGYFAALTAAGLIKKADRGRVKLLGDGDVPHALTVKVHAVRGAARAKIEGQGGRIEVLTA